MRFEKTLQTIRSLYEKGLHVYRKPGCKHQVNEIKGNIPEGGDRHDHRHRHRARAARSEAAGGRN